MPNLSERPQQVADQSYNALSGQHLFSQYMLQDQMRDQVFMTSLSVFRAQLRRIKKSATLRPGNLARYLSELRELRSQFDAYATTLRQKGVIQFTLAMELALWATRAEWFLHYQCPQVRYGWQQAAEGFQRLYDS
ncbi:MAG: hypothetical protein AAF821_13955 [Cyanobacteria bacterium P01_D01_bin.156]